MIASEMFDCVGLEARISVVQCRANRSRPLSSSLKNVPTRPKPCLRCRQWENLDPPLPDAVDPAQRALAETLSALIHDVEYGRLGIKYLLLEYNKRVEPSLQRKKAQAMAEWCRMLGFAVVDHEEFRGVRGMTCLTYDAHVTRFVSGNLGGEAGDAAAPGATALEDAPEVEAAVDAIAGICSRGRHETSAAAAPADEANIFAIPCEDAENWETEDRAMAVSRARGDEPGNGCAAGGVHREVGVIPCKDAAPCVSCRFFKPLPTFYDGVAGMRLCWAQKPAWDFSCFSKRMEDRYEARAGS